MSWPVLAKKPYTGVNALFEIPAAFAATKFFSFASEIIPPVKGNDHFKITQAFLNLRTQSAGRPHALGIFFLYPLRCRLRKNQDHESGK